MPADSSWLFYSENSSKSKFKCYLCGNFFYGNKMKIINKEIVEKFISRHSNSSKALNVGLSKWKMRHSKLIMN